MAWQVAFEPRQTVRPVRRGKLACLAEAGEASEGWRPGLDLNQDKERCTVPASTLPPPGRGDHYRSWQGEPCWLRINPNHFRHKRRVVLTQPAVRTRSGRKS